MKRLAFGLFLTLAIPFLTFGAESSGTFQKSTTNWIGNQSVIDYNATNSDVTVDYVDNGCYEIVALSGFHDYNGDYGYADVLFSDGNNIDGTYYHYFLRPAVASTTVLHCGWNTTLTWNDPISENYVEMTMTLMGSNLSTTSTSTLTVVCSDNNHTCPDDGTNYYGFINNDFFSPFGGAWDGGVWPSPYPTITNNPTVTTLGVDISNLLQFPNTAGHYFLYFNDLPNGDHNIAEYLGVYYTTANMGHWLDITVLDDRSVVMGSLDYSPPPPPPTSCNPFVNDIYTLFINTDFSISECFSDLLDYLFTPTEESLTAFTDIKDDLSTKAPFGYVTLLIDQIGDLSTTTASSSWPFHIVLPTFLVTYIFDPLKIGLGAILWFVALVWLYNRIKHIQL